MTPGSMRASERDLGAGRPKAEHRKTNAPADTPHAGPGGTLYSASGRLGLLHAGPPGTASPQSELHPGADTLPPRTLGRGVALRRNE